MPQPGRIFSYLHLITFTLALAGCNNAPEQQKHVTVAIICAGSNFHPIVKGFKEGMTAAGYLEGKNITYLYDGPTPKEQIPRRLTFLRQQGADLLYTMTTPITKQARKIFTGSKTPILFAPVFSPMDAGLVDAASRRGNNITGVMVRGSTAKTLAYLLECVPTLKTLFVPFNDNDLPARLNLQDLRQEADKHGIAIITADVDNRADIDNALQNIPKGTDAVWMTHSRLIIGNAAAIIEAATKQKLPVVSPAPQYKTGALLSYAPNAKYMGRQASRLADKILRGADASHIPVETAEYFFGINLKTANTLGIEIRNDILREADFIER